MRIEEFKNTKELEGCSQKTIYSYNFNLTKLFAFVENKPEEVTTQDIRNFLSWYKRERGVSNVTLDNMRRVYQSFFAWMHKEGYITADPCAPITKIKSDKVIKKPFTKEEIEVLRDNVKNIREAAVVELLYSSGMRISELAALNVKDIDLKNGDAIVFGKGNKERKVYFNAKAILTLKKYLDTRSDDNEALFVGLIAPHDRLKVATYQKMLRELGERAGVHCHPHKFRRTCATMLLNKGMPIQEVSKILGHTKIETTMIYCEIDQEQTRQDYKKFME